MPRVQQNVTGPQRGGDVFLDFLAGKENPLMAKYSKEQRDRAVDLYVRYERCAADVIRELGYPSRGMLPV